MGFRLAQPHPGGVMRSVGAHPVTIGHVRPRQEHPGLILDQSRTLRTLFRG